MLYDMELKFIVSACTVMCSGSAESYQGSEYMLFVVMLVKPIAWFFAFLSGTKAGLNAMLIRAAGITVFLTLADKVSVASNLAFPAIVLTLVLYAVMSFTLMPLAWKAKNTTLSLVLNLMGMLGAFAGVNFTMDFLRGLIPFMNR
jgi:hypothetical protein